MAQIFGVVEQSFVQNGKQHTIFSIPAISEALAKQRGKLNARIKGLSNNSVESVEKVGSGNVPGVTIYAVEVTSKE